MARKIIVGLVVTALALTAAACGDDGDDGGEGDVEAFCDNLRRIDDQEGSEFPTDEELRELVDDAPEEIRDAAEDVAEFAEEHRQELDEGDFTVLDDPEFSEAGERIDTFLREECPR